MSVALDKVLAVCGGDGGGGCRGWWERRGEGEGEGGGYVEVGEVVRGFVGSGGFGSEGEMGFLDTRWERGTRWDGSGVMDGVVGSEEGVVAHAHCWTLGRRGDRFHDDRRRGE